MNREFNSLLLENGKISTEFEDKKTRAILDGRIIITRSKSPIYDYFSLQISEDIIFNEFLIEELTKELSKIIVFFKNKYRINKKDNILVIGVGNEGLSADSLGAKSVKNLEITKHLIDNGINCKKKGNLSAISSSVSGLTGIESFDIISGVVDKTSPKMLIAVDTLATKAIDKLQKIIEISDKGISPGAGVNNKKRELSEMSLGIPTLAIGVPLVIYAKDIVSGALRGNSAVFDNDYIKKINGLVITPKEIDLTVSHFAKIIGDGINNAIH